MGEKVGFTNCVFEKLCFSERTNFIVFSAKHSFSKAKMVCWKNRKFMKNSGLFLNMAKWCFLGLFFFEALMLLWFVFGVYGIVPEVSKLLVFPIFWAFVGWFTLVYFRFGRFRCLCVSCVCFYFLLCRFCFCFVCFVFVLLLDCFLVLVLVLLLFLFFFVFLFLVVFVFVFAFFVFVFFCFCFFLVVCCFVFWRV